MLRLGNAPIYQISKLRSKRAASFGGDILTSVFRGAELRFVVHCPEENGKDRLQTEAECETTVEC